VDNELLLASDMWYYGTAEQSSFMKETSLYRMPFCLHPTRETGQSQLVARSRNLIQDAVVFVRFVGTCDFKLTMDTVWPNRGGYGSLLEMRDAIARVYSGEDW